MDLKTLARELVAARTHLEEVAMLPSARSEQNGDAFSLDDAYAVEAEIASMRCSAGHTVVGRKVGYANKAMWRILKLETLVWASVYEDTLIAGGEVGAARFRNPKLEPEIVVKVKDASGAIEWVALGFEILDNPYATWEFKPVDFVAAYGLHAGLVVGTPVEMDDAILEALATFKLKLFKNGALVEEGAGKNSLKSPALCLAEVAAAAAKRGQPLREGELVSTGTLTTAQPIAPGEVWRAEAEGLPVTPVEIRFL